MAKEEENNDELMAKFIASATPKLLEALTGQVTELVEKQIGGLVENSTKMLDQLKDVKRADPGDDVAKLTAALEAERDKAKQTAAGMDELFTKPGPLQLTREQARDPQVYRAAKAKAEEAGTTLQIVSE